MKDYKWEYGNLSMVNGELESYNTLYIDQAHTNADGLVLAYKGEVIGFISLNYVGRLSKKIYFSRTGILLINSSFYIDALSSLEEFSILKKVVIISKVDYLYNINNYSSNVSSFLGIKQTLINSIIYDAESWLKQIKKKHRYYVRKSINSNIQSCEVKTIDNEGLSLCKKLYDIYAEHMRNKGVDLLFSTKGEFINFINRNINSVIVTACFNKGELSYFNVVHKNKRVANYIMAVTTKSGLSSYASYMGIYKLYDYLYNHNFKILNFGGVDPLNNHGVYLFKRGFSGDLLKSADLVVVGTGMTARIVKKILQLRMLVKFR